MNAYTTCETVNKSSKSKNICYIDSIPKYLFYLRNTERMFFDEIKISYDTDTGWAPCSRTCVFILRESTHLEGFLHIMRSKHRSGQEFIRR